ncbi:undecaprenyl-diphosphatase [Alicyclobacillus shizuokensis]|uniref:undecaprenyl-diphosphatase n=1 Tax=Alicyclobacillus shizuokensis TaxID=392014 RepID=UPI00083585E6|nr:undecaprenyl-diphosphatase [Alicyclobacillus shizuokensis]MCL6627102.1 undecaprenyl-diphosphatase [Alicyclobacillus shizuokensis]
MNPFDDEVFHAINQYAGHTPGLDQFMYFIAQYSLELYALLFIIAWFALPRREEARRHALVVSVAGGVIALIINLIIGTIWYRPRPFVAMPHQVNHIAPHADDASFPSDHTSGAFGFTSGSFGKASRWVSWTFLILAILVMIARVYVGDHWPTDVLASVVVGTVSGRVAWLFDRPLAVVSRLLMRIFRQGRFSRSGRSLHYSNRY